MQWYKPKILLGGTTVYIIPHKVKRQTVCQGYCLVPFFTLLLGWFGQS